MRLSLGAPFLFANPQNDKWFEASARRGHETCQPWKGAAVPLPLKGLTPLTKIGSANTSIPSPFPTQNESPIRGSYTLPEFVPKNPSFPDLVQCFWMKSEGGTGPVRGGRKVRRPWKGLTPLTKIGYANTSIPTPFPTKNEPPTKEVRIHFRSSFPEPQFPPIWRNDFGCGASIRKPLRARGVFDIRERS